MDDYEVGVKGIMPKGFSGGFNSKDSDDVQGDSANSQSVAESKVQENAAQKEQQQQDDQEGQEGGDANLATVARNIPVATPRPVPGLQRQRITQ